MTLPPLLRDTRRAAGLSQTALAEMVGVRQQHVARWEGGKVVPNAWMAVRLAEALGTSANLIWPTRPPGPVEPEPAKRESEHTRRRREWNERKRRQAEAQT
jgi:DNA-binding XRE family transcriptional regulator